VKKWLIGILIFLAVVVVIIIVALQATKGVVKTADEFFALLREGRVEAAYTSTAKEFQAATSLNEFQYFLEATTIGNFARASWTSRSINNNTGKLIGSIHTKAGGVVPVEIDLVKEGGKWKILSLTRSAAGLGEKEEAKEAAKPKETVPVSSKEIPSSEALAGMINESVYLLGDGLNKSDLSEFYGHIAKLWQNQTDEASLRQAFREFIEKKVDLTIIQNEAPVLSEPPAIDDDGILRLKGYYATKPYMVYFDLGYLYEHPQWKLVAINVSTK